MKSIRTVIWSGLILCLLSFQSEAQTLSQEKKGKISKRIGIEMGFHEFFGSTIVPKRVQSVDASQTYLYDDYGGCNYLSSGHVINKMYVGIKYEALYHNNTIGIASGLRFNQLSAQLDHHKNYDAFIWLLRQDEQTSNYVMIRSMKQENHYVAVPLEIRYFPVKSDLFFKYYFKLGGALNYRFSTNFNIDFQNPEMSKYANEVIAHIMKPCTFSGFIFPAFGFRWGKNDQTWVNLEFQFPGFIIAQRKHSFVDPNFGLGMQLSVLLPLNK